MAKLTDEHKTVIVQRLAMYDPLKVVAAGLKEQFGIDVPLNQIEGYDANSHRAINGNIGQRWLTLFEATRARFKETIDDIPIANRAFRLRRLGQMHDAAFAKGAHTTAAAFLDQAAREVESVLGRNRRGSGDRDEAPGNDDVLTVDDMRTALVSRLADALAGKGATTH